MDQTTYDQLTVEAKAVGKAKDFMLENTSCQVTLWNGNAIAVKLPNTVTLKVTYTEPAVKGDTQSRVMKDATVETGAVVQVPTFIDTDESVIIDTRTGDYTGRVSK
jgi:elongation factor P